MDKPKIEIASETVGTNVLYTFTTEHGFLDASHQPTVGWFGIANVDVEPPFRRRGIGKALISCAFERALDAKMIYAAILSRECLDAMASVFGQEAVSIQELGSYTPADQPDNYNTHASLFLELN